MPRSLVQTVQTLSAGETERVGVLLGERLTRGACICLSGPLGAGKTVMVRGLCRGLGVAGAVTSPTFILMEQFEGRMPVVHVDLYRLEHEREVEEIGVFDYLDGSTVLIAEWGERSPALRDAADVEIRIDPESDDTRSIHVFATPEFASIGKVPG
jgi:tRNA threonylcarbamoyladenosine biosynthesis protein TsaE